jgi:oxygen-independent coproporphyrinogen-3 oxidase
MLGLYVHLPFCRAHCAYCPFVVSTDDAMQDAYVDALVSEITTRAAGEQIDTIFFGGGTPSHTAPAQLKENCGRDSSGIRHPGWRRILH